MLRGEGGGGLSAVDGNGSAVVSIELYGGGVSPWPWPCWNVRGWRLDPVPFSCLVVLRTRLYVGCLLLLIAVLCVASLWSVIAMMMMGRRGPAGLSCTSAWGVAR